MKRNNQGEPSIFPRSRGSTVGSKTVAMFGNFGLIAIQRLTAWKSRLALVESIKVLLLGFLMVFYSYDLNGQL